MTTITSFLKNNIRCIIGIVVGLLLGVTLDQGDIQSVMSFLVKCFIAAISSISHTITGCCDAASPGSYACATAMLGLIIPNVGCKLTTKQKLLNEFRVERSIILNAALRFNKDLHPDVVAKTVDDVVIRYMVPMVRSGSSWQDTCLLVVAVIRAVLDIVEKIAISQPAYTSTTSLVDAAMGLMKTRITRTRSSRKQ